MEKVLFGANQPQFLLTADCFTLLHSHTFCPLRSGDSQILPTPPPHKGPVGVGRVLPGMGQHKCTAIAGNTIHRPYPPDRGPSGTPRAASCPGEASPFSRTPSQLSELKEGYQLWVQSHYLRGRWEWRQWLQSFNAKPRVEVWMHINSKANWELQVTTFLGTEVS